MRIELLAFPGCPHAQPARDALTEALRTSGLDVPIHEIDLSRGDAPAWTRHWGSPTILIDGVDVAGEAAAAAPGELSCRVYAAGPPSAAQIRARLVPCE